MALAGKKLAVPSAFLHSALSRSPRRHSANFANNSAGTFPSDSRMASAQVQPSSAAPPCFFFGTCGRRADLEKAGRSVCRPCSSRLRGVEFWLKESEDQSELRRRAARAESAARAQCHLERRQAREAALEQRVIERKTARRRRQNRLRARRYRRRHPERLHALAARRWRLLSPAAKRANSDCLRQRRHHPPGSLQSEH